MSSVSIQSTSSVQAKSSTSITTAPEQSLLPAPNAQLAQLGDPMVALYAIIQDQQKSDLKTSEGEVEQKKAGQLADIETEKKAREEAEKAKEDAGGFWGAVASVASTVAEVAGMVVGAAACFVTGGAAAPLVLAVAALVLSVGGTVVEKTNMFGDASKYVGLGMEIGALACGAGGALIASGATAAAETAKAASTAVSATKEFATTARTVALFTGAGAGVVGGVATMEVKKYESREQDFEADAAAALAKSQQKARELQDIVEWMKSMQASHAEAEDTISQTMKTKAATTLQLTTLGAGARA